MTDRALDEEMVKALRAGMRRPDQQRAKLEKIQRMRLALEKLGLIERRLQDKVCDPA
jgi:hypothetical protein